MSIGMIEPGWVIGLTVVAFIAGVIDAIAGGGGLLTLPALLAAGLPPDLALGTNKGQSTFGSGAAFFSFLRAGTLDRGRLPYAFASGLAGSLLGAATVLVIPPRVLAPLVLGLLVTVAIVLLLRRDLGSREGVPPQRPLRRLVPIAFGIGFYDGFFGPGTGTFVIMAFVLWMGDRLAVASANAKVVNFASNLAALGIFALSGKVLWAVALPMACAQAAGGLVGARLVRVRGDRLVRIMVLLVVSALSVKIGFELWRSQGA